MEGKRRRVKAWNMVLQSREEVYRTALAEKLFSNIKEN